MTAIVGLVAGIALGAAGAWLVLRERLRALLAELARERAGAEEKAALLAGTRTDLEHTIKALAADALRSNNESFLELARTQLEQKEKAVEHLVEPIKASLERVSTEVKTLELHRQRDVGELTRHLRDVAQTSERVRVEAASLDHGAAGVRGARRLGRDAAAERRRVRRDARLLRLRRAGHDRGDGRVSGPTWSCGCRAAATSSSTRRRR